MTPISCDSIISQREDKFYRRVVYWIVALAALYFIGLPIIDLYFFP